MVMGKCSAYSSLQADSKVKFTEITVVTVVLPLSPLPCQPLVFVVRLTMF